MAREESGRYDEREHRASLFGQASDFSIAQERTEKAGPRDDLILPAGHTDSETRISRIGANKTGSENSCKSARFAPLSARILRGHLSVAPPVVETYGQKLRLCLKSSCHEQG